MAMIMDNSKKPARNPDAAIAPSGRSILRYSQTPESEPVSGDALLRLLYEDVHGRSPALVRFLARKSISRALAYLAFHAPWVRGDAEGFARANGIRLDHVLGDPKSLGTRAEVFLRKIDYEKFRPTPESDAAVVSAGDSKVACGDWEETEKLPVKNRFFDIDELLGGRTEWVEALRGGRFIIFRLAPPDYHWYHTPVAGKVIDFFALDGWYFSVNPRAVRAVPGLLSKNARQVAIIDTDVPGGTGVGLVAVVDVAAQVIGGLANAYSEKGYENPVPLRKGMTVKRGKPMGNFFPGSSTVVVLFQKSRVQFCPDLLQQQSRTDLSPNYDEERFGRRICEVALDVRDAVAYRTGTMPADRIPIGRGKVLVRDGEDWRLEDRAG